jgi:hypothetical protein
LINTLDLWEQEMLQHLTLHEPPFQLIQELLDWVETAEANDTSTNIWQMLFFSDGSELRKMMCFGWVLSTPTGTRLARCYGLASGPNTSHRAEATGMLAKFRFLLQLSQFCDCHQKWHVRYVSDNQGLITQANDRLKYSHSYPNATLAPDWDLVEVIHATNVILKATASYQHVLGHQNQHKQYEDLPLDAQLNVDADEEAGYFQSMHATVMRPTAPLYYHQPKPNFTSVPKRLSATTKLQSVLPPPKPIYGPTFKNVMSGIRPIWIPSFGLRSGAAIHGTRIATSK